MIHYKKLNQALQNGFKLEKVFRGIKCLQSKWLRRYIDINTEMRNKTKYKFEKYLYKSFNNTVYWVTLENIEILTKMM